MHEALPGSAPSPSRDACGSEHTQMFDGLLQPLSESEDDVGLMAYRTRSKRPLRDVPLGQLEAELRAPDITPDMYDSSSAHEDREWTDWLRGLMNTEMDNEGVCVRVCVCVFTCHPDSLSLSLQRSVMTKTTQNITSWPTSTNLMWRITVTTKLSASPVSHRAQTA